MNNIAIRGHLFRGKEVIQILESLGGKNVSNFNGKSDIYYYVNHNNNKIECHDYRYMNEHCKKYTLEEFEKEFPFKVGDKVKHISDNEIGIIIDFLYINNILIYDVDFVDSGQAFMHPKHLKPYKEMEEKRNITITIHKAKEWYNEGGELREIALQAYSKEELNKVALPKTWEEFCNHYPNINDEAYISFSSNTRLYRSDYKRHAIIDRNLCSSQKSAEAHLALIQLERLRDCYRQGDIPNFNDDSGKYCIAKKRNSLYVIKSYDTNYFLSFTKKEVAEEFLTNFEPLIKIAEDYI